MTEAASAYRARADTVGLIRDQLFGGKRTMPSSLKPLGSLNALTFDGLGGLLKWATSLTVIRAGAFGDLQGAALLRVERDQREVEI